MPLNPFNLRGPEFLVFFVGWTVVLTVGLILLRRRREAEEPRAEMLAKF